MFMLQVIKKTKKLECGTNLKNSELAKQNYQVLKDQGMLHIIYKCIHQGAGLV